MAEPEWLAQLALQLILQSQRTYRPIEHPIHKCQLSTTLLLQICY